MALKCPKKDRWNWIRDFGWPWPKMDLKCQKMSLGMRLKLTEIGENCAKNYIKKGPS